MTSYKQDIRDFLNLERSEKYQIIYADPPWKFIDRTPRESLSSSNQYSTMDMDELASLPIHKITANSSILFLWVPTSMMIPGIKVMESWGFSYKTKLYWVKTVKLGTGYYFRNQLEELWVGVQHGVRAFHMPIRNYIEKTPTKHSVKPLEFIGVIDQVAEKLNIKTKIELFARTCNDGWDCVGLENE
jgi:N6-adenosine-specific RNA methylase IME4